jgi:hypothetical protein
MDRRRRRHRRRAGMRFVARERGWRNATIVSVAIAIAQRA